MAPARRIRTGAVAAATVLLAATLAACGGDSTSAYCDSIEAAQKDFSTFETGDAANLEQLRDTFEDLADEAPDTVSADWQVLEDAFDALEDALEEAGLSFSDLDGLTSGEMPEDFDPTKLQGLMEDLQALSTDEIQTATENIEKHAKDECGVDLSEG